MRVALTGGAYTARSVIADCQRCLNLYPETAPQDASAPVTYYPTPGLTTLLTAGGTPWRGLFVASNGDLYGVAGPDVYYISPSWTLQHIGSIPNDSTPVRMADNSLTLVIVDGSPLGWQVTLADRSFSQISDGSFAGATTVDYLDTFLLFNKPDTPQFYSSLALSTTFDSLYFANKATYPDYLAAVAVLGQEIYLIGTKTTEVWYDSGATDFPFQRLPSVLIRHGCIAAYSVAKAGDALVWLSQDMNGQAIVLAAASYKAQRISTHAIETELAGYSTISDAVAWTYQQEGHEFYVLSFPTADRTWVYDVTTKLWHERAWMDTDGVSHRHRGNCAASAYGSIVVGDHENGNLYALDLNAYTDAGQPIERVRSFPHMGAEGKRVMYRQFIADMEVGRADGTTPSNPPMVSLRWSDDRGQSWGNPVMQDMGAGGEYLTSMQWQRLGMARGRVFELSWSAPYPTALQGAFIDAKAAGS